MHQFLGVVGAYWKLNLIVSEFVTLVVNFFVILFHNKHSSFSNPQHEMHETNCTRQIARETLHETDCTWLIARDKLHVTIWFADDWSPWPHHQYKSIYGFLYYCGMFGSVIFLELTLSHQLSRQRIMCLKYFLDLDDLQNKDLSSWGNLITI